MRRLPRRRLIASIMVAIIRDSLLAWLRFWSRATIGWAGIIARR